MSSIPKAQPHLKQLQNLQPPSFESCIQPKRCSSYDFRDIRVLNKCKIFGVFVKYLGYKLNIKLSDEDDILKELRTFYIRSNVLIRKGSETVEIKKINHIAHLYIVYIYIIENLFILKFVLLITMFLENFSSYFFAQVRVSCLLLTKFSILKHLLDRKYSLLLNHQKKKGDIIKQTLFTPFYIIKCLPYYKL